MNCFMLRTIYVFCLAVSLFLAGCAKKAAMQNPLDLAEESDVLNTMTQEGTLAENAINTARKNIRSAITAGAEKYAPETIANAKAFLSSAETAFGLSRFTEAIKNAEESSRLAKKARAVALRKIADAKRLAKARADEEQRQLAEIESDRLEKERIDAANKKTVEEERVRRELEKKKTIKIIVGAGLAAIAALIAVLLVVLGKKPKMEKPL